MADNQLSDLIVEPITFADYVSQASAEKWEIWRAGIAQQTEEFNSYARSKGRSFQLPYWEDLDPTAVNIATDDSTAAVPKKVTSQEEIAIKHFRNQGWSSADIVAAVASNNRYKDPLVHVADRVATYWSRVYQRALISSLQGIKADNIANDASDMTHVIATDAAGAPAAAELISPDAIITAQLTAGDRQTEFSAMMVHSVVYAEMQRQQVITFDPPSEAVTRFGRYQQMVMIVDDGLPAVAGVNRVTYTSVMFRPGAIAFGQGMPKVPVEVDRSPRHGTGDGAEELWYREHFILHPRGFKATGTPAATSPSDAELQTAAFFDRAYERKLVPMVFLDTNG